MQDIGLYPKSILMSSHHPYFAGDQVTGRTLSWLDVTWVTVFITHIDHTDKRQDGSTSTDKESSSHRSRPDGSRYRVSHSVPVSRVS
jgi:hypothetical protein